MGHQLGIDLGTSYCAAAVARDGRVESLALTPGSPTMPSVVFVRPDGVVITGDLAARRGVGEPSRVARDCKRRLGDPTPLILGGIPYAAESLLAELLRGVLEETERAIGSPPDSVVLTHPAAYGPYKLEQLGEVVRLAGLDRTTTSFVAEPVAAAVAWAARHELPIGHVAAVYDLGGGTFDVAMVRRHDTGFEIIGSPDGVERFGGIDIDAAVMEFVDRSLDGVFSGAPSDDLELQTALARLRDDCREAKEALSTDTSAVIPVFLRGTRREIRLTRGELDEMVRPRLGETVAALDRARVSAGLEMADIDAILLVGGSSRMPAVAEFIAYRTGRPLIVDAYPKLAVSLGAAALAAGYRPGAPVALPPVADPVPAPSAPAPAAATPTAFVARTADGSPTAPSGTSRRALLAAAAATVIGAGGVAWFATRRERGAGDEASAASEPEASGRSVTASTTSPARSAKTVGQLSGHSDALSTVTFSPDGVTIATSSRDGTAIVWDTVTTRQLFTLRGHTEPVWSAWYSADGTRLVTASEDDTAKVWSAADGSLVADLVGHEADVRAARFDPTGTRVVSAAADGRCIVWDATTGAPRRELVGHGSQVWEAVFSPDGSLIATASVDRTARIWDAATGAALFVLQAGESDIRTTSFSPDGARLLTAGFDGIARVWDPSSAAELATLVGHTDQLRAASFSPEGDAVLTASSDRTARLWDAATGEQLAVLEGHRDRVISATFSADGSRILTTSADWTGAIWDRRTGTRLAVIDGFTDEVRSGAVSPDGQEFLTGSLDHTARLATL